MILSCFIRNLFSNNKFFLSFLQQHAPSHIFSYATLLEGVLLWILNTYLLPSLLVITPISAHFAAAVGYPAVFYFLHMCCSVELCYELSFVSMLPEQLYYRTVFLGAVFSFTAVQLCSEVAWWQTLKPYILGILRHFQTAQALLRCRDCSSPEDQNPCGSYSETDPRKDFPAGRSVRLSHWAPVDTLSLSIYQAYQEDKNCALST